MKVKLKCVVIAVGKQNINQINCRIMKELETLLAEKIEERSKLNMEIFNIQSTLQLLKEQSKKL